jgi:hypothetical protein
MIWKWFHPTNCHLNLLNSQKIKILKNMPLTLKSLPPCVRIYFLHFVSWHYSYAQILQCFNLNCEPRIHVVIKETNLITHIGCGTLNEQMFITFPLTTVYWTNDFKNYSNLQTDYIIFIIVVIVVCQLTRINVKHFCISFGSD